MDFFLIFWFFWFWFWFFFFGGGHITHLTRVKNNNFIPLMSKQNLDLPLKAYYNISVAARPLSLLFPHEVWCRYISTMKLIYLLLLVPYPSTAFFKSNLCIHFWSSLKTMLLLFYTAAEVYKSWKFNVNVNIMNICNFSAQYWCHTES